MKKIVFLFLFIFITSFVTMLVMTSIALAEDATPAVADMPTPRPTSNPVAPIEPEVMTPSPEEMPQIDDFVKDYEAIIPMKAGEMRILTVRIASSEATEYEVIPTLVVSSTDEENIESVSDGWAWCFDEWGIINVSPEKPYELNVELIPPEDVPEGAYEFNWALNGKTVKTVKIKVTIY